MFIPVGMDEHILLNDEIYKLITLIILMIDSSICLFLSAYVLPNFTSQLVPAHCVQYRKSVV